MALTGRQQRHLVLVCHLGWTLDAFDFFIMVFVLGDIARTFGTDVTAVTWAITLALRARGAWVFGRVADRFGRRPAFIVNVPVYSVLKFASGFSPLLGVFILLRALHGIAMGGKEGRSVADDGRGAGVVARAVHAGGVVGAAASLLHCPGHAGEPGPGPGGATCRAMRSRS